jgi:TonB-linked SusC/RagA family outer membrane protein
LGDYAFGNVDWMKEYYKKWSPSQEHNLSVSGGNNKVTYYLSANIMDQDGFMRYGTEDYSRYNMMGKVSAQLTEILKVDYTSRFSRVDYARPTGMTDDFYASILRRARPVRPVLDPNGYFASDVNYADFMQNGGRTMMQNDETRQQIRITVTPLKDWNIIGELNANFINEWTHADTKLVYSHYASEPEQTYLSAYSASNNNVSEKSIKRTFLNPNIYTNYAKSFKGHNFAGTAGFQYENMKPRLLEGLRIDMITEDLPVLDLTTGGTYNLRGNYDEWATVGFFGRINYDYEGRYLAEANLRYDGSSRFRRDSRWVYSPSVSLGWNIARENFWESLSDQISMLKLRGSYGQLANQNTNLLYPTYQTMSVGSSDGLWIINGVRPNTSAVPSLISTSLTWEKVKSLNFGLDWGALNNRLTGSFDYFIRNTNDMVGAGVELPSILGTAVPNTNNMAIKTIGWELQLEWKDAINDFLYGVRLNLSDARTKVMKYANPTGKLATDALSQTIIEGHWLGTIYGYETIGIAKSDKEMQDHLATLPNGGQDALGSRWAAGDIMYRDLNGDGRINNGAGTIYDMGDWKKLGDNTPRYLVGLNIDASWKNISLQMFWQGVLKRDHAPWEVPFWGVTSGGQWWNTGLKEHLDYFRADPNHPLGQNLNSYYPRPLFEEKNIATQSRYILNAAYMRLKSLQLGYTIPSSLTNRVKLEKVKLFVSGENLLTLTSLSKVLDPESVGIGNRGGVVYPLSKTYSFGINVNF